MYSFDSPIRHCLSHMREHSLPLPPSPVSTCMWLQPSVVEQERATAKLLVVLVVLPTATNCHLITTDNDSSRPGSTSRWAQPKPAPGAPGAPDSGPDQQQAAAAIRYAVEASAQTHVSCVDACLDYLASGCLCSLLCHPCYSPQPHHHPSPRPIAHPTQTPSSPQDYRFTPVKLPLIT